MPMRGSGLAKALQGPYRRVGPKHCGMHACVLGSI